MAKEATTLSIDKDVKKDFKIECLKNNCEMSETVESFMIYYIKSSKEKNKD